MGKSKKKGDNVIFFSSRFVIILKRYKSSTVRFIVFSVLICPHIYGLYKTLSVELN